MDYKTEVNMLGIEAEVDRIGADVKDALIALGDDEYQSAVDRLLSALKTISQLYDLTATPFRYGKKVVEKTEGVGALSNREAVQKIVEEFS